MKHPFSRRLAAGIALAGLAVWSVGCTSTTSEQATRYQRQAAVETYPVSIIAVDGLPVASGSGTVMEPGARKVTVVLPRDVGAREGEQRTIDLNVKACTKYWLVASRRQGANDFEILVDHEQRVYAGCTVRAAN